MVVAYKAVSILICTLHRFLTLKELEYGYIRLR